MACYISSNNNRFYTAVEQTYGEVPLVDAQHRFPAVKLSLKQEAERLDRRDKTGSRTFPGPSTGTRRSTTFELETYMTAWTSPGAEPGYGPLFQAALGGGPLFFDGGTAASGTSGKTLAFSAPHGLSVGQAVTFGGEIRFVAALVDNLTVLLDAAFTLTPSSGSPIGSTVTYVPDTKLKSVSIVDYWSPAEAVQRILCGAAVDRTRVRINGDIHEFRFSGAAMDVIDSSSFVQGEGGLASFPTEPAEALFDYTIIPGHLGQAWLGSSPDRFFTITDAEVIVDNDLDLRSREFGSSTPRCISAGMRSVLVDFELYEQDDAATKELYQAARQRSPVEVTFQLGQEAGRLFGVYMRSVVPEVPEFDDSDTRLRWRFRSCQAHGTSDDEVVVAFG
jgi:hypothetical protein